MLLLDLATATAAFGGMHHRQCTEGQRGYIQRVQSYAQGAYSTTAVAHSTGGVTDSFVFDF